MALGSSGPVSGIAMEGSRVSNSAACAGLSVRDLMRPKERMGPQVGEDGGSDSDMGRGYSAAVPP